MRSEVWYEYEFKDIYSIISELQLSIGELVIYMPIFLLIFVWVYFTIYKIRPLFFTFIEFRKEVKLKLKKKQFIERIKLQNEIEDEVEKDLK